MSWRKLCCQRTVSGKHLVVEPSCWRSVHPANFPVNKLLLTNCPRFILFRVEVFVLFICFSVQCFRTSSPCSIFSFFSRFQWKTSKSLEGVSGNNYTLPLKNVCQLITLRLLEFTWFFIWQKLNSIKKINGVSCFIDVGILKRQGQVDNNIL